jgi:adenylate cyclase
MFQFEGFTLDVTRGSLRTGDRDVALRRKSFDLLRYLLENPDRLVTKDELLKAIWPNVVVTDESLTQCVSEIRQAIGDSRQTTIVTVPRRGYRFAVPVFRAEARISAAAPPTVPRAQPPPAPSDSGPLSDRPPVAVLPFANLSGDPQQDYFSDGITEDITTELSRFSELMVIGRNSALQYKGKAIDLRQVGRELGARYLLEGSARRSGERVRITAQLVEAATGAQRWAERYDREIDDVFAVQDEVVRAIVTILAAHVNRAEIDRALLKPPAAPEAYDYYLRGAEAYFLHMHRRTKASVYDARRLLDKSLAIDPDYARAAAMLSQTRMHAYVEPFDCDYLSPAALDRAFELAKTAVHLDPRLPQAHAQLGYVLLYKRQHDAAIRQYDQAFTLNPNLTDNRFASVLICAGEPVKALKVLEANIRLDPFQPLIFSSGLIGLANYMLKRYGEAVRLFRECALRLPNLQNPHLWLASACALSGQLEEAKAEAAEVLRVNPGFTIEAGNLWPFTRSPGTPSIASMACARRGCLRVERYHFQPHRSKSRRGG